jgi:zinc D-Ala-D-Ala carboxypeptidase
VKAINHIEKGVSILRILFLSMKKEMIFVLVLFIISGCENHYSLNTKNSEISNQQTNHEVKEENINHNLEEQNTSDDRMNNDENPEIPEKSEDIKQTNPEQQQKPAPPVRDQPTVGTKPKESTPVEKPKANNNRDAIQVVAEPHSIPVLINKTLSLPENFMPQDLVYLNVSFIFSGKSEKRMMRKEAANELEHLFEGAKEDGVTLLGVSAYRSYQTQKTLFERYVAKDGYEKARTYSAVPGTSEHQTGLSIDVTGGNGKCPAESCFAGTKEAIWLEQHAANYGYIIRYPKGKDAITGYTYEPWHLRYVGKDIAIEVSTKSMTLEEYYHVLTVSK